MFDVHYLYMHANTQDKMDATHDFVWKKEWDMGISDEELISLCDQVMKEEHIEESANQLPENSDCEEATFDDLLDLLDM